MREQWKGFVPGNWQNEIDVRDFIQKNYTPYEGDRSFLSGPTARTNRLMEKVKALLKAEQDKGGVLDVAPRSALIVEATGKARIVRLGKKGAVDMQ